MDEQLIWAMYFSAVVSFQYHPGQKDPRMLEECAVIADAMLQAHRLRFGRCHGSDT